MQRRVFRFIGRIIKSNWPGNKVLLADHLKLYTSTPGMALELLPSIALSSTQAMLYINVKQKHEIRIELSETVNNIRDVMLSFLKKLIHTPEKGIHFRRTSSSSSFSQSCSTSLLALTGKSMITKKERNAKPISPAPKMDCFPLSLTVTIIFVYK